MHFKLLCEYHLQFRLPIDFIFIIRHALCIKQWSASQVFHSKNVAWPQNLCSITLSNGDDGLLDADFS